MTTITRNILDLIGKTPLVEISRYTSCSKAVARILIKVESFNPGGSVKDRVALAMIQDAEEKGIPCYISLEERMACGIGACLACVCKTKGVDHHSHVHNARICKDGPVFLSTEVEL